MTKKTKLTLDQALALFQLTVAIRGGGAWKDDKGNPFTWNREQTQYAMDNYSETADAIMEFIHKYYA
jgi:hypothetical protein